MGNCSSEKKLSENKENQKPQNGIHRDNTYKRSAEDLHKERSPEGGHQSRRSKHTYDKYQRSETQNYEKYESRREEELQSSRSHKDFGNDPDIDNNQYSKYYNGDYNDITMEESYLILSFYSNDTYDVDNRNILQEALHFLYYFGFRISMKEILKAGGDIMMVC